MSSVLLAYERDQDLAAIETVLQARGYRVLKAHTGLEALDVARHEAPHAVVSDVLLPRLDGFALCRRLKEDPATRYLPFFLLSFRVEGPKYEAFAAEVGAQRFFPRGSTLEDLAAALEAVKAGSNTMRMPALVPELIDRQEQDRRRVADLERQVRELLYTNKLLAAAERAARTKVESDARERAGLVAAGSDKERELQQRIAELEAHERELIAVGSDKERELQQHMAELETRERQLTAADSDKQRELQQRIAELEAGERERAAADSGKVRELQQLIADLENRQQALTAADSDKVREQQQRIAELEARQQELAAAESKARDSAEQSRASLARVGVLEARLSELQSSRARSQAEAADAERAFGAQPIPTLLSDMETLEIRAVSDSAAALLGIAPHHLLGRSLAEVLPGASPGEGGALPSEAEVVRADQSSAVFEFHRTSVSYAGRACWLTALVDVTADRAGLEAQRLASSRAAALEGAPVAACMTDAQGAIVYANAGFRALLGLEPGKAETLRLQELEAADHGGSAARDTGGSAPTPGSRVATWRRPGGSSIEVELSTSAVGEPAGACIVIARDVTPLRRSEDRIERDRRCDAGLLDLAQHTHMLTESEVPGRALDLAREITGSEAGYAFLAVPDAEHLEIAGHSEAAKERAAPQRWRGAAPAGTALAECSGSLRVVERETAEGTGSLRQAGLPGTLQRQLVTPILDGGRLAGILLLANKREAYDEDDRRHAVRIAEGLWKALRRRRSDAEIVSAMDHMERVMLGTVEALGAITEAQDGCKTGRARRVAELAASIGTGMGLPGHTVRGLRVIGQLIDVGMLHIPREILWRAEPLGAAEFELVKTHADRGFESLRRIDFPWPVAEAVRQHHERHDGSGYPRGLKGEEILLEARIVAVADAVEAMLSRRPQRPALSMTACIDELQSQAGRRYDAAAVRACVKLLRERQGHAEPEKRAGQRIA